MTGTPLKTKGIKEKPIRGDSFLGRNITFLPYKSKKQLAKLEKFINKIGKYKINTENNEKEVKSKRKKKSKYHRKFTKEWEKILTRYGRNHILKNRWESDTALVNMLKSLNG
jgi:hypothetical protein